MTHPIIGLAVLALIFGFPVGDSLVDREPEARAMPQQVSNTLEAYPVHTYVAPYGTSPYPARLAIPAVDVAAQVRPVGMGAGRSMQVPFDIGVVGWFDRSVYPTSEIGHTVLVGHRDGSTDPNGVFRNLGALRKGDEVTVHDLADREIRYVVTSTDLLSDAVFAESAEQIFRTSGAHRLILISCGGSYDAARGGYQSNVVVVAKRT